MLVETHYCHCVSVHVLTGNELNFQSRVSMIFYMYLYEVQKARCCLELVSCAVIRIDPAPLSPPPAAGVHVDGVQVVVVVVIVVVVCKREQRDLEAFDEYITDISLIVMTK